MSEQAVATMGRCGCGWLDQARELEGGVRVASGVIVGGIVVGVLCVFVCFPGGWEGSSGLM